MSDATNFASHSWANESDRKPCSNPSLLPLTPQQTHTLLPTNNGWTHTFDVLDKSSTRKFEPCYLNTRFSSRISPSSKVTPRCTRVRVPTRGESGLVHSRLQKGLYRCRRAFHPPFGSTPPTGEGKWSVEERKPDDFRLRTQACLEHIISAEERRLIKPASHRRQLSNPGFVHEGSPSWTEADKRC